MVDKNQPCQRVCANEYSVHLPRVVYVVVLLSGNQTSEYRQKSLDNIESAKDVLQGRGHIEERAKAQASPFPVNSLLEKSLRFSQPLAWV